MKRLDMLEPGTKMCKAIAVFLVLGIVLIYFFHFRIAGMIMLIAAGITFLLLLILLAIEQHQDHKQYLDAKKNDPEIK